jgi:hypothetical protein
VTAAAAQRTSSCCGRPLVKHPPQSTELALDRCPGCGSLWAARVRASPGLAPWSEQDVTEKFYAALKMRRERQARTIVERMRPLLAEGPVLDYACGQGAFLRVALSAGVDAWGCDIVTPEDLAPDLAARVIHLDTPWSLPDSPSVGWQTIALLDVLEHHPEPLAFARSLPAAHLVVKVPIASGPIGLGARAFSRIGRSGLIETLFLVGDAAPHTVFFTIKGLRRLLERAGWRATRVLRLADVGRELPDRIRNAPPAAQRSAGRAVLAAAGALLAAAAPAWPDTAVVACDRRD